MVASCKHLSVCFRCVSTCSVDATMSAVNIDGRTTIMEIERFFKSPEKNSHFAPKQYEMAVIDCSIASTHWMMPDMSVGRSGFPSSSIIASSSSRAATTLSRLSLKPTRFNFNAASAVFHPGASAMAPTTSPTYEPSDATVSNMRSNDWL